MPESVSQDLIRKIMQAPYLQATLRKLLLGDGDLPPARVLLFPHPLAWAALVVCAALTAAWFAMSPLHFVIDDDMRGTVVAVLVLASLAGTVTWRGFGRLGAFLFTLPFFIVTGILGRALNYLFVSLALPLQDNWLARVDAFLGFDWPAVLALVGAHPWLAALLHFAYGSYGWLFPLTFIMLPLMGRLRRLREFLLLFSISGLMTVAIGALFPALGPFDHHAIPEVTRRAVLPEGLAFMPDFLALRSGTFHDFVVARAEGLTAFPSFHTIMALLFALAFRGTFLGWPVFVLAMLTICATPVIGGHYFADLLGGAAVFMLTVLLLHRLDLLDAPQTAAGAPRLAVQAAE